jgi:hypothetical protein
MRCLWEYDEIGFTESKPRQVAKNLYSYHLSKLIEEGVIQKAGRRYVLTRAGRRYVDGIFGGGSSRKIDLKILVRDEAGETRIIGGRLLDKDTRTNAAAARIVQKKLNLENPHLVHLGDAYIRIFNGQDEVVEYTFSHIFELKNTVRVDKIREYLPAEVKEEILFVKKNADGHFFFERDYLID